MNRLDKRPWALSALVLTFVSISGCFDNTLVPEHSQQIPDTSRLALDPAVIANTLVSRAGWPVDEDGGIVSKQSTTSGSGQPAEIRDLQRQPITGDVVHYKFLVSTGPAPYDVIGIHRVVREPEPNRPLRTGVNVFLLHGDYKDFEGCFLPGPQAAQIPDEFGFAVHLAQNDVDVWGVDQAWCLVTASETDFSFMADWGMQRQVDDLNIAMSVARHARLKTGNGFLKMILAGYSSGSTTGFALLNQETQIPPGLRNVGAYIPVDQGVVTDVPAWQEAMCAAVAHYQELIDGGQYQDFNPLPAFGTPALEDPSGPSALIPGFNNLQAGLALGVFPFFSGVSSHFLAGTFDADGVPTGLQYTDVNHWIDFMINAPPYEPLAYERDEYITNCPQAGDVSWDDHLGEVDVPILYVMAGGGFGYTGAHTLNVLGSRDIERLSVSLHPPDEVALDFAHIDLFLANDARDLVWEPILTWIRDHSRGSNRGGPIADQGDTP